VLVALLEVLLHHLADGRFVENNVVLAIGVILAVDGSIGQHQRPGEDPPLACLGKPLLGFGKGLEWFLDGWHIGEGHKLHTLIDFIHGHPVHWKFHSGKCINPQLLQIPPTCEPCECFG